MDTMRLTRDEAIKLAGIKAVEAVEAENCEPTNRVGFNGPCQGDDLTEWAASVTLDNGDTLTAYYYTDEDDEAEVEANGGDWGGIDWEISHYEIM